MKQPNIESVSEGIYKDIPSEDVVGHLQRERSILAWAIDGASTLSESPFTTFEHLSDAGWFARELATLLAQFKTSPFCPATLQADLATLRKNYCEASENARPLEDWPVAAAIIAEIDFSIDSVVAVSIYRYADCFALTHQGELPGVINNAMPKKRSHVFDPWKPYSGFQGHELNQLRQRRREQQRNEFSTALTLNPESALNATVEHLALEIPSYIFLGTDGLSRIWETYGLMDDADALRLVARAGLPALLDILRTYEASIASNSPNSKRRDDASGICFSFR